MDEIEDKEDIKDKDLLKELKDKVENSWQYFRDNYVNFHSVRWKIFNNGVDEAEKARLNALSMPVLNVNILESTISRQVGEFAASEPGITVFPKPDGVPVDEKIQELVEGIMRNILLEAKRNEFEYGCFRDAVSGGFSVMKVWTDYVSEMSFNQEIKAGKAFDPTLCGFDPMAREPHKGDGEYCFEIYPLELERFKREYPNVDIKKIKYYDGSNGNAGFNFRWAYHNGNQKYVMLCILSCKRYKRIKIAEMTTGVTIPLTQVDSYIEKFKKANPLAIVPTTTRVRYTQVCYIHRYEICDTEILKSQATDFRYLPLVFVDGNSVMLRGEAGSGDVTQFTRPSVYQAIDAQRFKNLVYQSMAYDLANQDTVQYFCPVEAIPDDDALRRSWTQPQGQRTLYHKSFMIGALGREPLPPPQKIGVTPFPVEKMQLLLQQDQAIQNILGSFDMNQSPGQAVLSGKAIIEANSQNNTATMPYIQGFLTAFTQVANIILDLIPKYLVYPRNIGIIDKKGKKRTVGINGITPDAPKLDYHSHDLGVVVEAGVNFKVQQEKALQAFIALLHEAPQLMLPVLQKYPQAIFDNLDVRGADILKGIAEQLAAKAENTPPPPPPPNPMVMKEQNNAQRLQLDQAELALKHSLEEQKLELEKFNAMTQRMKVMNDAMDAKLKNATELHKINVDADIAGADIMQKHRDSNLEHERHALDKATEITAGMISGAKEKLD